MALKGSGGNRGKPKPSGGPYRPKGTQHPASGLYKGKSRRSKAGQYQDRMKKKP